MTTEYESFKKWAAEEDPAEKEFLAYLKSVRPSKRANKFKPAGFRRRPRERD